MKGSMKILGHDVYYEADKYIPAKYWEEVKSQMISDITWAIQEDGNSKEGICESWYIDEYGEESDDTGFQVDVDVKWNIIEWKQVADKLYDTLSVETAGYSEREKAADEALKEYEELIKLTDNGTTN